MQKFRVLRFMLVAGLLAACGGDSTGVKKDPPVMTSIEAPSTASVESGVSSQLTATAKDQYGAVMQGREFRWTSDALLIAEVSNGGSISGQSPGTAVITVTDVASGLSKTVNVDVTARTRIPGSIITIGRDSVFHGGAWHALSTLGMVDTLASGRDHRIGIMHVALPNSSMNAPVTRANFPLMSAVAECSNGNVYLASFKSETEGVHLWRADPRTAIVTRIIANPIEGVGSVTAMHCDATGVLLVVARTAVGSGFYHRINPTTLEVVGVRHYSGNYLSAIAGAPDGTIYVPVSKAFTTSLDQNLARFDPIAGSWEVINEDQLIVPRVTNGMAFRGSKLFAFTEGKLSVLSAQTGAPTVLRDVNIP